MEPKDSDYISQNSGYLNYNSSIFNYKNWIWQIPLKQPIWFKHIFS